MLKACPTEMTAGQHIAVATLLVLTFLAAGLRIWQCNESLWLDELHTAWVVDEGIGEIAPRARAGNYGPVYFLLPWFSTRLFGMHEWSLRLPSLMAGIALVPVCYAATRSWFRSRTLGCLAAALTATDPQGLFYSLEARPYAVVQLGAVLHVWLLTRLLNQRGRGIEWLTYCLLGAVLFQLHYTTALLFVGEFFLLILWYGRGQREQLSTAVLWTGVMYLSCLSAVETVRQIARRREIWHQFIDRAADFVHLFPWIEYLLPAALALLMCWAVRQVSRRPQQDDHGEPELRTDEQGMYLPLLWILIWLVLPLVVAFTLTRLDIARLFYRRYVMFSYPALVILAAGLGTFCKSQRERVFYALLMVSVANVLLGPWQQFASDGRFVRHSHESWRDAVAEINAELSSATQLAAVDTPVLVRSGLVEERLIQTSADIEAMREYVLFPVSSIYPLDTRYHAQILTSSLLVTESTRQQLKSADYCWLLIRGTKWFERNSDTLLERLHEWMGGEHEWTWDKRRDFGNVVVVRCQTATAAP